MKEGSPPQPISFFINIPAAGKDPTSCQRAWQREWFWNRQGNKTTKRMMYDLFADFYVKSGDTWTEVGEFPYPDFGAVKVQVWLDEPMDIDAVGTIAQCSQPNIFWFRQTVTDFAFEAEQG